MVWEVESVVLNLYIIGISLTQTASVYVKEGLGLKVVRQNFKAKSLRVGNFFVFIKIRASLIDSV